MSFNNDEDGDGLAALFGGVTPQAPKPVPEGDAPGAAQQPPAQPSGGQQPPAGGAYPTTPAHSAPAYPASAPGYQAPPAYDLPAPAPMTAPPPYPAAAPQYPDSRPTPAAAPQYPGLAPDAPAYPAPAAQPPAAQPSAAPSPSAYPPTATYPGLQPTADYPGLASQAPPVSPPSYDFPGPAQPAPGAPSPEPLREPPAAYDLPAPVAAPSTPPPGYTPAAQAPGYERPAYEQPVYEPPAYEPPVVEQPAYVAPASVPPSYEAPSYEAPASFSASSVHDRPPASEATPAADSAFARAADPPARVDPAPSPVHVPRGPLLPASTAAVVTPEDLERATTGERVVLGLSVLTGPIGLIAAIVSAIRGARRRGWLIGIARASLVLGVLSTIATVIAAVVLWNIRVEQLHHADLAAASAEFCAAAEADPSMVTPPTLGWPAPGHSIPEYLESMTAWTARWTELAATSPPELRTGMELLASKGQTIIDAVTTSRSFDDEANRAQIASAEAQAGVANWYANYCAAP